MSRRYGAGSAIEDLCRACKQVRGHTVIVADGDGRPMRVVCDFCGSQHNFRGGERERRPSGAAARTPGGQPAPPALVSPRERSVPMSDDGERNPDGADLELLLRRVFREECGMTPVAPAEKWRGGTLEIKAGRDGLAPKSWPFETFFSKVVMVRNRLRTLEQQINAAEIPADLKVKLQGYITGCYGSLTSFNILFADEQDRFRGSGGGDRS